MYLFNLPNYFNSSGENSSELVNGRGGIQSAHLRRLIGAVVFHFSWAAPEMETRQGVRAPLRGHKNIGVLSNAGPGSLGGRRAAGSVFNVWHCRTGNPLARTNLSPFARCTLGLSRHFY